MATSTHLVAAPTTASPLALWHLLSLDAPLVAVLWTWFIARANHIRLPLASAAAMAIAVWALYAADRLLDARTLESQLPTAHLLPQLEARHFFHHRHRTAFLAGIGVAFIALAALLPQIPHAAIRLYLVEGTLLIAWFLILHATRSAHRLPKEIAVGLFFAAAVFIPTIARVPILRIPMLPDALLFASLCSLNCLYIYAWEHEDDRIRNTQLAHATTHLALRHLLPLTLAAIASGALLTLLGPAPPGPISAACTLSAAALLALHRNRRRLSKIHLRAAADLALLTPLALLLFLR